MVEKLDYEEMKACMLASIDDFRPLGAVTETKDGIFIYRRKEGNKILFVAHLDTVVQKASHFHVCPIDKEVIVYAAQHDDRLGAYLGLYLLPKLGLDFDILLTEGEEHGRSTAAYFTPPEGVTYNWMFQFDRAGDDVVMYDYETADLRARLKEFGLKPGHGSFTDICKLEHLGCKGINFGVGYHNNHSVFALAYMSEMIDQVNRFVAFYKKNAGEHLAHTERKYTPVTTHSRGSVATYGSSGGYGWYKGADDAWHEYKGSDATAEADEPKNLSTLTDAEWTEYMLSRYKDHLEEGMGAVGVLANDEPDEETIWLDSEDNEVYCNGCGISPDSQETANYILAHYGFCEACMEEMRMDGM